LLAADPLQEPLAGEQVAERDGVRRLRAALQLHDGGKNFLVRILVEILGGEADLVHGIKRAVVEQNAAEHVHLRFEVVRGHAPAGERFGGFVARARASEIAAAGAFPGRRRLVLPIFSRFKIHKPPRLWNCADPLTTPGSARRENTPAEALVEPPSSSSYYDWSSGTIAENGDSAREIFLATLTMRKTNGGENSAAHQPDIV